MANSNLTPYSIHAPIIGKPLFRLAVDVSRSDERITKKSLNERIQSKGQRKRTINGSKSQRAALEAVETAIEAINDARNSRAKNRWMGLIRSGRSLPQGTLERRLHRRTEAMAIKALAAHYRTDDAGTERVVLTRDPAAVGVEQRQHRDFDYYGGAWKNWSKKITTTTITLPHGWLARVKKPGLTVLGGMLTLDAQRLEGAPEGVRLYAAKWLEQSRGYAVRVKDGVIGIDTATGAAYHAATAKAAIRGCVDKGNAAKLDDLLDHHDLPDLIEAAPSMTVRVQDARATGSCEYGIRSWCYANGLDYEAGEAPLADVYAAYQTHPMTEARLAILHALRRSRSAVRQIARQVGTEAEAA